MSILDLKANLVMMYADQLIKAEGDIKNNSKLTKETIQYQNKQGKLVHKTVYKNEALAEDQAKTKVVKPTQEEIAHEDVKDHQDLISGDIIRCTTKSGKVVTGTYTRKTSQVKKGVKTEFLEFIKPDGSKGYVSLNGSVKLERQKPLTSQDTSSKALEEPKSKFNLVTSSLSVKESFLKLQAMGVLVFNANILSEIHENAKFDLLAVYQNLNEILDKSCQGKVKITPQNFNVFITETGFTFRASQKNAFNMSREFDLVDKTVGHNVFYLDEKYQNGGLGKELFRMFYREYKKLDVKKIKVHANIDIGGYSWMAYGFSANFEQVSLLLSKFEAKIGKTYGANDKVSYPDKTVNSFTITKQHVDNLKNVVSEYRKANPDQKKFPMNILAKTSKDLSGDSSFKNWLISTRQDWFGEIDLTNQEQSSYFETYIGYNKP